MSAPQPETIGNRLLLDISDWVMTAERYLSERTLEVIRWERDIEKLAKVDAVRSSLCRAKLAECFGDIDRVEYWYQNALAVGASVYGLAEPRLVSYSNLGFASRALSILRQHVDLSRGNISSTYRLTAAIGAYMEMERLAKQAHEGGIQLFGGTAPPDALAVSQMLREAGVGDDECTAIMDAAGEVLRDHRLFWLGVQPDWFLDEDSPSVLVQFRVAVSPEEATAMTLQVVNKLIDRDLDRSPYMVGFIGVA